MKRILTLDLIRGSCIMLMVAAHTFSAIFDRSMIGAERSSELVMLDVVFLIVLAYLSGFTGLFLMVSIISHTISMREQLKNGSELKHVIMRQIVGGLILLIFAFLVESTLGHHGFIGRMAYFDPGGPMTFAEAVYSNLPRIFYRGFHFMTLHTIAWSIIICTLLQWLLYRKGGLDKDGRNVKVLLVSGIFVLLLTPLAWGLANSIVPGYPLAEYPGTDRMVQYPLEGVTTSGEMVVLFFLGPLAGQTEPLFPFLFYAFIGCIIGIYLSMDRPPDKFFRRGLWTGIALSAIGLVGVILYWTFGLDSWENLKDNAFLIMKMRSWVPIVLFTAGGQVLVLFGLLRLIEERGIARSLSVKLRPVRRFAVASLTVYTLQYFDSPLRFLLSQIPGVTVFGAKDGLTTTIVVMALVVIYWHVILLLWSSFGFIGSVEWLLSIVQRSIGRTSYSRNDKRKWYRIERLGVLDSSFKLEWAKYLKGRRGDGRNIARDERLALRLSIAGLFFLPLSVISFLITKDLLKRKVGGKVTSLALNISRVGLLLGSAIILVLATTKNKIVP